MKSILLRFILKGGVLLYLLLSSWSVAAQSRAITGTITSENDMPLPGVSVLIKGTTRGTVSDAEGNYSITVSNNDAVLQFTFIGFVQQEIPVGSKNTIDVSLKPDTKSLEEVVVTGYAIQREENITGAIETISFKDEPDAPVSQIGQKLQGKMAGVRVRQVSGRPGEGMNFQIRGAYSLTAGSEPLYVVDGMPITGDINFLSPYEIENITVLKDPAAASLYGSRASNGVVLIQTNKADNIGTEVSVNAYYGFESIPEARQLDMMNAREYATFQREIAETNNRAVDPAFENPSQYGEGTDWFDAITRTGAIQNYNVNVSTGGQRFKANANVGYFNQEGVVEGTSFERFSMRLNSRYEPIEQLEIGFNVAPTFTVNTNFNTDGWPYITENIVSSALLTTPLADPFNPDGTLTLTASDPATFGNPNWLRVARDKVYENNNFQLLSNAYLNYEIVEGLNFKTTANVQLGNQNIFEFNPSTIGVLFVPPPQIPSGSNNDTRFVNWVNENTLNYRNQFGKHDVDALVGFTAQASRTTGTLVEGTNFPDDKVQTVNAAGQTLVSSTVEEWSLLSMLARFNYQYDGKYLFTASVRRDGSSRFGADNRWGNFPALSAGWILSKENFWALDPVVNFFKIRASYGITGNFQIGNFTSRSTINEIFYPLGNTPVSGRAPNNLGDQALGWENNIQFNLGADINLFNDRIQFAYNFYTRNTTDLLFNVEVPVSSGFNSLQTNIGELRFWGHEFSVRANVLNQRDLSWNTNFNISIDRNETVALGGQSDVLPSGVLLYQFRSHISEVGQPVTQFYGAVHDGVYVDQEDFDNSPKHTSSQVGTVKFRDLNGDGEITFPADMTAIGNPWPDFVFGMTNQFRYRNFDLSVAIVGSVGNEILAFYENWTANLDGVFNVLSDVQNRWKSPEEPGDGLYGSVQQGTTFLERDRWNSRMIKDGSYLSVNNITLGYTFPLSEASFFKSVYLYSSIQNAFVLTNYPGMNPEVNTQINGATGDNQSSIGNVPGVDENSYPIPRTTSFGLTVRF